MEKTKLFYIVDVGLLILIVINYGATFSKDFKEVHEAAGNLFIILLCVHIVLHWPWIVNTTKKIFN